MALMIPDTVREGTVSLAERRLFNRFGGTYPIPPMSSTRWASPTTRISFGENVILSFWRLSEYLLSRSKGVGSRARMVCGSIRVGMGIRPKRRKDPLNKLKQPCLLFERSFFKKNI